MGIEDELQRYLLDDDEPQDAPKTRRQVVAELIAEVQSTAVELSTALKSRGVPTEPIMVMSDHPTSSIAYFFKGDRAKPWVEKGRGWAILPYTLLVDTNGALWNWGQIIPGPSFEGGREGWVRYDDFENWQHQFTRDIPASHAFVLLNGDSLSFVQDGDSAELIFSIGTRVGNGYEFDERPLREHMIRGAARLIESTR